MLTLLSSLAGHLNCGSGINGVVLGGLTGHILTAKRCGLLELYDWQIAIGTQCQFATNNFKQSVICQSDDHVTCLDDEIVLVVAGSVNGAFVSCKMGSRPDAA